MVLSDTYLTNPRGSNNNWQAYLLILNGGERAKNEVMNLPVSNCLTAQQKNAMLSYTIIVR